MAFNADGWQTTQVLSRSRRGSKLFNSGVLWKWILWPVVRWLLLLMLLSILTWLVYVQVWLVLQSDVPLPAEVIGSAPGIDERLLEEVNVKRLERLRTPPIQFGGIAERVFDIR